MKRRLMVTANLMSGWVSEGCRAGAGSWSEGPLEVSLDNHLTRSWVRDLGGMTRRSAFPSAGVHMRCTGAHPNRHQRKAPEASNDDPRVATMEKSQRKAE